MASKNKNQVRRASDILTGRFGDKWMSGAEYTILNARIEQSTFDGQPSEVAVFTTDERNEKGEDKEVFSGSAIVVQQAKELLEEANGGEDVFPLVAKLAEHRSKSSKFSYFQLE